MVGAVSATITSHARIRIVLSDDGTESRRALHALLAVQPDIDVVGFVDDGDVALRLLRLLKPDIALLDEDMAAFGAAAVARVLAPELPELRVVVLTKPPGGETWTSG